MFYKRFDDKGCLTGDLFLLFSSRIYDSLARVFILNTRKICYMFQNHAFPLRDVNFDLHHAVILILVKTIIPVNTTSH